MNREYLIDIAMDAYHEASGQSVSRPWMEAAFDTIAPRIWDEGFAAGMRHANEINIDNRVPRPPSNPYTQETA